MFDVTSLRHCKIRRMKYSKGLLHANRDISRPILHCMPVIVCCLLFAALPACTTSAPAPCSGQFQCHNHSTGPHESAPLAGLCLACSMTELPAQRGDVIVMQPAPLGKAVVGDCMYGRLTMIMRMCACTPIKHDP